MPDTIPDNPDETLPAAVFLASQPRAGSTLLQKTLASHSWVATASEPWIMLQATSALRPEQATADGKPDWARVGADSFIGQLPEGRATLVSSLRQMYNGLYRQAAEHAGARMFLDKTPRYYLIIPELLEVFPESRLIILLRNPLAVLVSMLKTWSGARPGGLRSNRDDLLVAPALLRTAMETGHRQLVVVRYEDLLANPVESIRQLCNSLEIPFQEQMTDCGAQGAEKWVLGDQDKVYEESGIDPANAGAWVTGLDDPAVWRLCSDYLNALGEDLYSAMGYDWDQARRLVRDRQPSALRKFFTWSLDRCTRPVSGLQK